MRPEAKRKAGFYAIAPEAITFIAERIRPPNPPAPFTMLDPCAGRGEAIQHWAATLGCPEDHVYAIELEEERAVAVRELMPSANVLGPCSMFGCKVQDHSLPFIWLNPPFDDAMGGGARVELQFLDRVSRWLVPEGVMVLLCPEDVMKRPDMQKYFRARYREISVVRLPEEHRPYREVAVIAYKRKTWGDTEKIGWLDAMCKTPITYQIPSVDRLPAVFEQTEFTPAQLRDALTASPLLKMLQEPPKRTIPRPPLELGHGHIALLLASGLIDGIVCPEGEPPHVVRGVSRKEEYLKEVEVKEDGSGHTEIWSERIEMVVRTVDVTGTIKTFASGSKQESAQ